MGHKLYFRTIFIRCGRWPLSLNATFIVTKMLRHTPYDVDHCDVILLPGARALGPRGLYPVVTRGEGPGSKSGSL